MGRVSVVNGRELDEDILKVSHMHIDIRLVVLGRFMGRKSAAGLQSVIGASRVGSGHRDVAHGHDGGCSR